MRANTKRPIVPIHGEGRNNYTQVLDRLHRIINGNISMGGLADNNTTPIKGHLDNVHVSVSSNAAINTDIAVTHNLGRLPTGFTVVQNANGAIIYSGVTAPTTTLIYIRTRDITPISVVLQIY